MIKSQTIDAVINQVTTSPSSIFPKEDVLKLIEGMDYGIEREKEMLIEGMKYGIEREKSKLVLKD